MPRVCHYCKQAGRFDRRLYECTSCRRAWHASCQRPWPTDPSNWVCKRCQPNRTARVNYAASLSSAMSSTSSSRTNSALSPTMAQSTAATTPESTDYQFPAVVNTCSYAGCHESTCGGSPLCEAHMVVMLGQKFVEQTAKVRSRWPEQPQQQGAAGGAKPSGPNAKARGSTASRASASEQDARPSKSRLGGGPKMTKSAPRASTTAVPDRSPPLMKNSSSSSSSAAGVASQQRQKSPTSPSADRSAAAAAAPHRPIVHSPPQSPSQSGARTLKRQKLQTNGYNHQNHQTPRDSPSRANGDRTPVAPLNQDSGWRLGGRQSPVSRGYRESPVSMSAAAMSNGPLRVKTNMNGVANGLPNGYDQKGNNNQTPSTAWTSPVYSAYPAGDKQPKTPESKKAIPKAIAEDILHWFNRDGQAETKSASSYKHAAFSGEIPAAAGSSWGGVAAAAAAAAVAAADGGAIHLLDSSDGTRPRPFAIPGYKPSGASSAATTTAITTTPQRSSRREAAAASAAGSTEGTKGRGSRFLLPERLHLGDDAGSESRPSLESWIYGRDGAPPPPRGVQIQALPAAAAPPRARRSDDDDRDSAFFAAINPQTHWTRERSAAWLEAKQLEIKARGGRKARTGRVAERMAEQRQKDGGPSAAEDRLPDRIRTNPTWMRAMAWFDRCDKAQWEADKEAARQLEIQQQLEREAGSRTARRTASSRSS